ncbi:MAG: preprotein translocase subunit SecA [Saprospiraceae bacterium]|nr:preprotein translocase subunit SecA [Saprospiraceae bacterium]
MFDLLKSSLKKIFGGSKQDKDIARYQPLVDASLAYHATLGDITHDELRAHTIRFKNIIAEGLAEINAQIDQTRLEANDNDDPEAKEDLFKEVDALSKDKDKILEEILLEILPEAFAVVKETCKRFVENETITVTATDHDRNLAATKSFVRIEGDQAIWSNHWMAGGGAITWNMIPYDVQLIGAAALHEGKIAEMATGEGKTLVSTLPAYLNGLSGMGVHIITVNDYLAKRDSEWVGPIHEFLMLKVDCIDKYQPNSISRKHAYECDIVYGTNSEFGFDYLRDNMVISLDELVQKKHHYAMIDEVDSVLIDDARTPLIISGPVAQGQEEQEYIELKPKVEKVIDAQRRLATQFLTEARRLINEGKTGTDEGEGGMALLRAHRALPKNRPLIKYLSEEGIKVILQKAENFYMQEQSKNMHKVDASLYFTIDEKNRNVELTDRGGEFLSQGSEDPTFFIMPDISVKLTEIDKDPSISDTQKKEDKENLIQEYAIKSRRLHSVNQLLKAYTLFERDEEYVVIEGQVKIVDEQTGRMMEGRRYSDGLHQALEAKENVKVGDITQTYATVTLQNYFRMYHKLSGMTGTAETEAKELWDIYKLDVVVIPTNKACIRDDREDLVYKTNREKFNAVIDEIVNLSTAGRPVLVGTTSVEISEKMSRMLQLRNIKHNVLNAKQHQREAEIVAEAGKKGNVTLATNMAGRGTDIKISDEIKALGGLAIIGTERHESRRVDRQLRGRAGRQGDPGTSQFYVSLEDSLMRLFATERMAAWMDKLGLKEGEVIQHNMVTKSIERAQKKVEENNFGIRKRLLEYDDVMNIQREAIYTKRRNALSGERLVVDLNKIFQSVAENIVTEYKGSNNFEGFREESMKTLGFDPDLSAEEFQSSSEDTIIPAYQANVREKYERKKEQITDTLLPVIKQVHDREGQRYKRISIPFTDGRARMLPISADIEPAVKSKGKSIMLDIEKAITLSLIDDSWKEHLRNMDELKDSVQGASFEQKDPLVIYKMEAYELFEGLVGKVNKEVASYLMDGKLMIQQAPQEARERKTDLSKVSTNRRDDDEQNRRRSAMQSAGREEVQKVETIRRTDKKIGRNDPCPCGSGKKYKQCHGANA